MYLGSIFSFSANCNDAPLPTVTDQKQARITCNATMVSGGLKPVLVWCVLAPVLAEVQQLFQLSSQVYVVVSYTPNLLENQK